MLRNLLLICFVFSLITCDELSDSVKIEGHAFGTTFHIQYYEETGKEYSKQIDSLFHLVNKSLSTYIPNSSISRINRGDTTVQVDAYFKEVYTKSFRIFKETNGVFDPTIGVLVNAWGFGPEAVKYKPDSLQVKELLKQVGFNKIRLVNGRIEKEDSRMYIDFNAIAKGYALDVAGRFFESKNIHNYLIEIGGEVRTKGVNKYRQSAWKIGIEEPNFEGTRSIKKVVILNNESMATSGNYRKFVVDSLTGQKYVHILNAKTGHATKSNILSASVIGALDCADVDGYATAIMAMTLENAKLFLAKHDELRAYLIYSTTKGEIETYTTLNF